MMDLGVIYPFYGQLLGALGILCVTLGIFISNQVHQDILFVVGGLSLLIYSIFIGDLIFVALQLVFIAAALYEIWDLGGTGERRLMRSQGKNGNGNGKNGKR